MLFPSHVKRIIFCFVYSKNHHPSCIYPSLKEEILQPYIVDVDSLSSPHPILKDESFIPLPIEYDHSSDFVKIKIDSKPVQSSTPFGIIVEPCHQPVESHDHPTAFQIKIRMNMFKPLRFPYLLHPYPLDYDEYLPRFSGENQVSAERHLESFEDFVDRFRIVHEDVIMRFFSMSLIRHVFAWFKGLRVDSIGSWIKLSNDFLNH